MKKILLTIPHYYDPKKKGNHGSLFAKPETRAGALAQCINNLHSHFGPKQIMLSHKDRFGYKASVSNEYEITVVICTVEGKNLLGQIPVLKKNHSALIIREMKNPRNLGFVCQDVMKERLGQYDFYCFMEDDIIINDSMFFSKLEWFNKKFGPNRLLHANRYELCKAGPAHKVFVDGALAKRATAHIQQPEDDDVITAEYGGQEFSFERPSNPHSGVFFLNKEQMEIWASKDYFAERDHSFISPLESSASLGIMKTFSLYKPSAQNAHFFEVQHHGAGYARKIGGDELPLHASLQDLYGPNFKYKDKERDI